MTITIHLATVAASIAALKIAGVKVRGLDEIPTDASKLLPVLYPLPNGFITAIQFTRVSQGGAGAAQMNLEYTLNYRYLHSVAGGNLGLFSTYESFMDNLAAIIKKIFSSDNISGVVDLQLAGISNIGPLTDPAGSTTYHGVDIALRVLEFVQ
jgi:hypothetical protein